MKRDDRLFSLSILFVIIFAGISVWRTYKIKNTILTRAPVVDIKVIETQVESGNLSIHEAKFYKTLED